MSALDLVIGRDEFPVKQRSGTFDIYGIEGFG